MSSSPMDVVREYVDALTSGVRFGQFLSVGAVGAVFDLSVSSALIVGPGVRSELAKLAGAEVAILVMFALNDRWTFADEDDSNPWYRRLLKSNLVRSGGVLLQVGVVFVLSGLALEVVVGGFDFWQLIPLPIAIAASVLFNYLFESLFTWRVQDG